VSVDGPYSAMRGMLSMPE